VFTTLEAIDTPSALIVDSGGSSGPFLPDKLYSELLNALQNRPDSFVAAREITNTVIVELLKLPGKPLFGPRQISAAAAKVLKNLDKQAYLRYVAEHPSLQ
jgi:transcriptional regulator NrdR family protein